MRTMTLAGIYAILILGLFAPQAPAAEGSFLFAYDSSLGTMPKDQGWHLEAESLERGGSNPTGDCPLMPVDGQYFECFWFGGVDGDANTLKDNDGTMRADGHHPSADGSGGGYADGIDSPMNTPTPVVDFPRLTYPGDEFDGYLVNYVWKGDTYWKGTESYSEWVEFDDDGDNLAHLATLSQHLPHGETPKTDDLINPPAHQPLRFVGGDGNGIAFSLPYVYSFNNQNGKVLYDKTYAPNGTVTVVFRGALGVQQESQTNSAFLMVRAGDPVRNKTIYFAFTWFMPRTYSGGVEVCDADPPTADCGKFGVANYQSDSSAILCSDQGLPGSAYDRPLLDALGQVLPNTFFTFRAICDPSNGGKAIITLNEDTPTPTTFTVDNNTFGDDFDWGCKNGVGSTGTIKFGFRDEMDTTVWIDKLEVYEGVVPPPDLGPCDFGPNPVFDVALSGGGEGSDGAVDQQDYLMFEDCATGPSPDPALFDPESPSYITDRCFCMDVNEDLAVDQEDFGVFQRCYTGTGGTVDPDCDD